MRVLRRLFVSSARVAALSTFALTGCGSNAPVSSVPISGSGSASVSAASTSRRQHETVAPHEVERELPLSWRCEGTEPEEFAQPLDRDVITTPVEDTTLSVEQVEKQRVHLNLPKMDGAVRAMIALDHHPAREATDSQGLRDLVTEWDAVEPGSHRLLVFWLDEAGLPLQLSQNASLTFVRRFFVESRQALPLEQWYLVSPRGTLNAKDARAESIIGYPFGLTLLGLNPQEGLTLTVERGGVERSGRVEAGNCVLGGFQSGDYAFTLRSANGESVTRMLTVNLDLGEQ